MVSIRFITNLCQLIFVVKVISRIVGSALRILDPYIKLLDSLLKSCFTLGRFPCFEIPGYDEKLPPYLHDRNLVFFNDSAEMP